MTTPNETPETSASISPPTPSSRPPHTLRTVLLVVGSVVLAIIIGGTAVRVAYSLSGGDRSGTFPIADHVTAVEVNTTRANVTVEYSDVTEAEITYDNGGTTMKLNYGVEDGELEVSVGDNGWAWWNWFGNASFGNWGFDRGPAVTISLPKALENTGVELTVESTAGDVAIRGHYGEVDIETTAGDLRMSGAADDLEISTTAGDSTIKLNSLPESIEVRSTAGDIRMVLPDGRYRIETRALAGDVRQDLPSDASSHRIYRFGTTAGDIELRNH